jgi:CheY-like chemotaxis protein
MTRILLVDDEPDLLEAWSFALEHVGYEVERANGAQEALLAMQRRLPDLVITDLMMPGMSGEELSRALRANPHWMHIPIVLHTSAHVDASAAGELWNAVLRKPARMNDFLATVARLSEGG